ncbi:MAG: DUF6714 family protein [Phycisphaerales bacterium]
MVPDLPKHLARQQRAIEAQIREAFKGVTREGGVSWTETDVIDANGSDAERAAARASDRESGWGELVDDPKWEFGTSWGGFSFLDAIGFRYYLPPAMIRDLRDGVPSVSLQCNLHIDSDYQLERVSLFNAHQSHVVARFVRFMIAVLAYQKDTISGEGWTRAYVHYWRSKDRGTPLSELEFGED